MNQTHIPLIVLGGSDRKPATMPATGSQQHPLTGYKGLDIRIGGRPMVEILIERLWQSDCFAPIHLAGPRQVYGDLDADLHLFDTNGSFAENIHNSLEPVVRAHPGKPAAFITCDVLPEVEVLRRRIADYWSRSPCDLYFPLVKVSAEDLAGGASSWKPTYRIVPARGEEAVATLPGHLLIVDPEAMRREFLYDLFQVAYDTRNRPVGHRRNVMLRRLLSRLVMTDLVDALRLSPPTLTWTLLRGVLPAVAALRKGKVSIDHLERALQTLFVRRQHRRAFPERKVHLPITDDLSLALDVDTEEEAVEVEERIRN
jgi:hypothetical protein